MMIVFDRYFVLVSIGFLILCIVFMISERSHTASNEESFKDNGLISKIIPIIVFLLVKVTINRIASTHVFLSHKTGVLALDNFRAFNIFLFFNFFLDAFRGAFSAIYRLIKTIIAGFILMPSELLNTFSNLYIGNTLII